MDCTTLKNLIRFLRSLRSSFLLKKLFLELQICTVALLVFLGPAIKSTNVIYLFILSPTGAWIITEGFREGVGKCVGEAVRDHATAASSGSFNKVVAVGIASWGLVYNKEQLINPEVVQELTH